MTPAKTIKISVSLAASATVNVFFFSILLPKSTNTSLTLFTQLYVSSRRLDLFYLQSGLLQMKQTSCIHHMCCTYYCCQCRPSVRSTRSGHIVLFPRNPWTPWKSCDFFHVHHVMWCCKCHSEKGGKKDFPKLKKTKTKLDLVAINIS